MELGIPGLGPAEELGRTPAATTYRSMDATGRSVVVKVLAREASPEVWARFDHDQLRLAELAGHPNVVAIHGHGRAAANLPYVVLEDVRGGSFADKVGAGLDGVGVMSVGIKIAGALESCHRRDVVHGDMRPEDILIDATGEPQVADFGLVMSTGYGPERATTPGRIAHASPEQLAGQYPTPLTDVYALGSILYALLAGAPAFVRAGETSATNVGMRIRGEAPAPLEALGVPGAVAEVVERALAKDPAARWTSAEAMGVALQQAQVKLGQPLTPMVVTGPDRVTVQRTDDVGTAPGPTGAGGGSKAPLLVAGVVAALVVAGIVFFVVGRGGDDPGLDRTPITAAGPDAADFEFREVSDDGGVVTLQAPDIWPEEDGRPLPDGDDFNDIVVANGNPVDFTRAGVEISGIEVTVEPRAALDDLGAPSDADGIRNGRVADRNLTNDCATNRPPEVRTIAGFEGATQQFDDCGEVRSIIVFGGVTDEDGMVIELHVLNDDDAAVVDAVLDSISAER